MKVAVLGGTGKMGGAIAKHLSKKYEVIIGSRDPERAEQAAAAIPGAKGADYISAAKESDVAIIAVPNSTISQVSALAEALGGKLVISIVNPLRLEEGILRYGRDSGSAAEELAKMLPKSRVATAFNNVPVAMMKMDVPPPMDILIAASSKAAFEETAELVKSIPNLRPLYTGPLSEAQVVERVTALVLNLAKLNDTGSLTTKFVSRKG